MAITFTLADSAGNRGDPALPDLGSAPAEGNLLVCFASERAGTAHADYVDPSGWTKALGHDNELADGNAQISTAMWTKRAGSSESQTVSIDNGTANDKFGIFLSFLPSEAVAAYSVISGGTSTAGGGTSSTSPIQAGNTSSLSAADYFIIAYWAGRTGSPNIFDVGVDFTEDILAAFNMSANNQIGHFFGAYDDLAGGIYNASLNWSGDDAEHIGSIAVIQMTAAAGGANPHGPLGHPLHGALGGPG